MYVIQWQPQDNCLGVLHELDKKGLKLAKLAYPNHRFEVVSGRRAHVWVSQDWPHTTPLWIDYNGRIRYARDAR
jgi:hypothetical protein